MTYRRRDARSRSRSPAFAVSDRESSSVRPSPVRGAAHEAAARIAAGWFARDANGSPAIDAVSLGRVPRTRAVSVGGRTYDARTIANVIARANAAGAVATAPHSRAPLSREDRAAALARFARAPLWELLDRSTGAPTSPEAARAVASVVSALGTEWVRPSARYASALAKVNEFVVRFLDRDLELRADLMRAAAEGSPALAAVEARHARFFRRAAAECGMRVVDAGELVAMHDHQVTIALRSPSQEVTMDVRVGRSAARLTLVTLPAPAFELRLVSVPARGPSLAAALTIVRQAVAFEFAWNALPHAVKPVTISVWNDAATEALANVVLRRGV